MQKGVSRPLVLIAVFTVVAMLGLAIWLAFAQGWMHSSSASSSNTSATSATANANTTASTNSDGTKAELENITLICELNFATPINGLDAPPQLSTKTIMAGLDFKNKSGWYQGDFSISESRKGAMVMQGSKAVVNRPAMFERFGVMIIGEQFTLDRTSGEFTQTLTFKGGRKVDTIKGYCGGLLKAPF